MMSVVRLAASFVAAFSAGYMLTRDHADECNIAKLNRINDRFSGQPIDKYFRLFDESVGVSCDNILSWQESFHAGGTGYIDGIKPEDMTQPLQWGIDSFNRPFIAVRHSCDAVTNATKKVGAMALFQRYSDEGGAVTGGHYALGCTGGPGPAHDKHDEYTKLFSEGAGKINYYDGPTTYLV